LSKKVNIESGLVLKLKEDDHGAFKALFDLYSQPLYRFANSYLKSMDVAEDVVQEVFTKIWNNRKELKTDTSFKSYLFTIALNAIRKHFNGLTRQNEVKHDLLLDASTNKMDFDDREDYQFLLDKLEELIGMMPEKRREVFVRKKFQEMSIKEIAMELNISPKTVEYHITESLKFLKQEFKKLNASGIVFFQLFVNR
jgi:RNA polymerase sigma-70 factor (ECF subfamily)